MRLWTVPVEQNRLNRTEKCGPMRNSEVPCSLAPSHRVPLLNWGGGGKLPQRSMVAQPAGARLRMVDQWMRRWCFQHLLPHAIWWILKRLANDTIWIKLAYNWFFILFSHIHMAVNKQLIKISRIVLKILFSSNIIMRLFSSSYKSDWIMVLLPSKF